MSLYLCETALGRTLPFTFFLKQKNHSGFSSLHLLKFVETCQAHFVASNYSFFNKVGFCVIMSRHSHVTPTASFYALSHLASVMKQKKMQLHSSSLIKHPKSLCHITGRGLSNNISRDYIQAGQQFFLSVTGPVASN